MEKLTAATLHGIWSGLTMCWDADYGFDERTYAANAERAASFGAAGLYTTGSTGEFYALEFEVFRCMVDIIADVCGRHDLPLQIGCCSDATAKTVQLLEYAASKPQVGAVQVNIPYWMELTDAELVQFFKDLATACPDMPLVHYNIPRAKRFLHAADYLRILEAAPKLIGVKYTFAGAYFGALQDDLRLTPMLSYFVAENLLVSAMMLGARGCYSSVVNTNPKYMLDLYAHAAAGRWDEAIKMQQHVARFLSEWEAAAEEWGEGLIDPVGDKAMAVASGCLDGHQRCRPPYIGWSDAGIARFRQWLQQHFPEFIYPV